MELLPSPSAARAWSRARRAAGERIGFVPTMGALHEGHRSLIRRAAAGCDAVLLSIFVNPSQFGPGEDFDRYPRPFAEDCRLAEAAGAEACYAPEAGTMYAEGYQTWVAVEGISRGLCGEGRPGHFRGVATVVTKLLLAAEPDVAYFGWKDAQQGLLIRRMVRDLDLPVEVALCPIVREADGMALSSRNRYLSGEERARALSLSRGLAAGVAALRDGARDPAAVTAAMGAPIEAAGGVEVDYLTIQALDPWRPAEAVRGALLLAGAVRIGKTRLIDNVRVEVAGDRVTVSEDCPEPLETTETVKQRGAMS